MLGALKIAGFGPRYSGRGVKLASAGGMGRIGT